MGKITKPTDGHPSKEEPGQLNMKPDPCFFLAPYPAGAKEHLGSASLLVSKDHFSTPGLQEHTPPLSSHLAVTLATDPERKHLEVLRDRESPLPRH